MQRSAQRPEIQTLRALAVALVVGYHLWPGRLAGGYIGVDVFFVISGYLITAHLVREVDRTGRISLGSFWARRARRLLPASIVVLVAVGIAICIAVPDTHWRQYFGEIAASTLYVQNWLLAGNSIDYLAAENLASPVQHFWSLSLEEQFYVLWPLLILGVVLATRRRNPALRRRALIFVLASLTLVSLVTSIVWTAQVPASAYFVTPTRIWEFGLGGLLAFVPLQSWTAHSRARALMSWAGFATIVACSFILTGASGFPGAVALVPVLGTVAVIAAGNPQHGWAVMRLGRIRAVQFVGDVSYSLYLWHWPVIVIAPFVVGAPLGSVGKVVVLFVSIVLAYVTKILVEDRFRYAAVDRVERRTAVFVAVAVSAALVVAGCGISLRTLDERVAADARHLLEQVSGSCFGAAAMDERGACPDPFTPTGAMAPALAKADSNLVADPRGGTTCEVPSGDSAIRSCDFGSLDKPGRTIAMLGDSHALQFSAPMAQIAEKNGWHVITFFKSACSGTGDHDVLLATRPEDQDACATWGEAAIDAIVDSKAIDTVVFSNLRNVYSEDGGGRPISAKAYTAVWDRFVAAGKEVVVIADIPGTIGSDIPDCIEAAGANPSVCNSPQSTAVGTDVMAASAIAYNDSMVRVVDLTDKFCRDGVCHVIIGGAIVYSDAGHLTTTYATSLAPYLELALLR